MKKKIFKFLINIMPRTVYFWGLKFEKTKDVFNIYKKNKCIRISEKHIFYLPDIFKFFDFYFDAVYPVSETIKEKTYEVVDYSYPHPHKVKMYNDHTVKFSSFVEPVNTSVQYIKFADLDENSVVIDLGAYSGLTSILFDKEISKNNNNAQGRVIAVDADFQNIPCIEYNFNEYKKVSNRTIEAVYAAATSHNGTISFSSEGNMGASAVDFIGKDRGKIVNVNGITLSKIAEKYNLQKVDFIKCDIEGSETEVFKDSEFFKKNKPKIIVEIHKCNHKYTADETRKHLEKYGYKCTLIKQTGCDMPLMECVYNENRVKV